MKLSETLAFALLIMGAGAVGQTTAPKTIKKPLAAKTAGNSSKKKAASNGAVKSRALVAGPPRQATPSSERYKEIQDALVSKGYMTSPSTGVWNQESVDAMKHYQSDQKLDPTGKVNAKSLINLGLGPKDESLPSSPPTPNK